MLAQWHINQNIVTENPATRPTTKLFYSYIFGIKFSINRSVVQYRSFANSPWELEFRISYGIRIKTAWNSYLIPSYSYEIRRYFRRLFVYVNFACENVKPLKLNMFSHCEFYLAPCTHSAGNGRHTGPIVMIVDRVNQWQSSVLGSLDSYELVLSP